MFARRYITEFSQITQSLGYVRFPIWEVLPTSVHVINFRKTNIRIYRYLIIPQSEYCSALALADWLQLARR